MRAVHKKWKDFETLASLCACLHVAETAIVQCDLTTKNTKQNIEDIREEWPEFLLGKSRTSPG